jgi:hypothetical protein
MTIHRKFQTRLRLLLLTGMIGSFQLRATTVFINNFAFDAQVLGVGSFTNNILTDWTVVASGNDEVGAFNPTFFTQPVPDGPNTAYLNPGGEFYQDVGPLIANATYNFSVFVGRRADAIDLPVPYNIQLLDASTSVIFASGVPGPPGLGDFVNFNLGFDSAAFASSVGDNIRIEFSAGGTTGQANFNDVTLAYSLDPTVPEPSSFDLALLGIGIVAIVRLRRSAHS